MTLSHDVSIYCKAVRDNYSVILEPQAITSLYVLV